MSYSMGLGPNRQQLRVLADSFCSVIGAKTSQPALVLDLSEDGIRLQRPLVDGLRTRRVQLEFELPEVDEIVWASGEVCFDQISQKPPTIIGARPQVIRTSGIRLLTTARRHHNMLRDYVNETWRRQFGRYHADGPDWFIRASCYFRG